MGHEGGGLRNGCQTLAYDAWKANPGWVITRSFDRAIGVHQVDLASPPRSPEKTII